MKYEIIGDVLPAVILYLQEGESVLTEGGAMSWMSPNMQMQTTSGGGVKKMIGRAFSGESLFQNVYTATGGNGMIACASSFPGAIKAFDIIPGKGIIMQKRAFLCAERGVQLSTHIQKKIGGGLFGGEGFIMQKVSGNGLCFAEFDGSIVSYDLQNGEEMIVDTGNLAAMEGSCSLEIRKVPGVKNMFFGGEGLFNTVVSGPGKIWIQTMPIPNLANIIRAYIPTSSN